MGIHTGLTVRAVANAAARDKTAQPAALQSAPGAKFRRGEVLHGHILEAPSHGLAKVELPTGIVIAGVTSENLKRGDTLLFSIQSIEPKLVLKVDAVPTRAGDAEVAPENILRILGWKESVLNLEIVRMLSGMGGFVRAETIADLEQALGRVHPAPGVELSLRDSIAVLARMRELGIPLEPEFFSRMNTLILGKTNFAADLAELYRHTGKLPRPLQEGVSALRTLLAGSLTQIKSLMQAFTLRKSEPGQTQTIYEVLRNFVRLAENETGSQAVQQAVRAALSVLEKLEGQHLYNIHASQRGDAIVFNIAVPYQQSLLPARIEITTSGSQNTRQKPLRAFRIGTATSALGDVVASGSAIAKNLTLALLLPDKATAEFVDAFKSDLQMALQRSGYNVRSLKIHTGHVISELSTIVGAGESPGRAGVNVVV